MKTNKCKRDDCAQPRMVNVKTGQTFSFCEFHQREYWRSKSKAKQPGKNVAAAAVLNGSIGDNGTAIEAANGQPAKTSRLSEAEKADIIRRSQERIASGKTVSAVAEKNGYQLNNAEIHLPANPIGVNLDALAAAIAAKPQHAVSVRATEAETCADDCTDCLYKEVVAVLEKHVPGVRQMVDGLKLIRGQK